MRNLISMCLRYLGGRQSFLFAMIGVLCVTTQLRANPLCDQAARVAAGEHGVPVSVLMAITRTETGRQVAGELRPWPWTINREGKGYWFKTRDEAIAFARGSIKDGRHSFDTGCFQINYRWHGAQFPSVEHMFDPVTNARYAARFLARLYAESGDWSVAAGTYHSRTKTYATRYRKRFEAIHARLLQDGTTTKNHPRRAMARGEGFPLLVAGAVSGLGSLVPRNETARTAFIRDFGEGS